jgi:fucose permease
MGTGVTTGAAAVPASGQHLSAKGLLMQLFVGTEFAFAGWLPSYCMNKQGARLSEQAAAGTVSVFWACMTAGRLLSAFARSRAPPSEAAGARCCHPVDLLLAALVLCAAAAMAALALLDGAAALWACVAAAGLFYSAIMPTVMAYLSLKGVEAKGDSLGRLLVGASIGGIAAPSLTAQLFGSLGDQMAGISEMVRCHGPWLWGDRFSIMSPSEASGSAAALLAL